MLRRLQGIGAVLLGSLLTSAACSDDDPESSGGGGAGGKAGQAGQGGKGGKGGSGGKAGAGGKGGNAGSMNVVGGAGGQGTVEPPCPSCASGFCLEDGTCVDCLPSDDQCELGQYCTVENSCVAGCKEDTLGSGGASEAAPDCASGICGADHNCDNCISDDECTGEDVCNSGECGPACTEAQEGEQASCQSGLTCCSLHCVELLTDSNHCGSCGAGCGNNEFCGISTCTDDGAGGAAGAGGAGSESCVTCYDTVLANVCAIGKVIVILDTNANANEGNRIPGRAIGEALGDLCDPTPIVEEKEQDSGEALNFTSGRPVSGGGELLLVAGGPFYQNLEGYVEEQGVSPLYVRNEGNDQEFRRRDTDAVVVSRTVDTDNLSHDFFIIQFMREPQSGSLVLNAQGFWLSGTTAASYMMLNGILPNLASYDQAWYAYEWTDGNGDMNPQLDEIVLRDSGL